MHFCLLGDSIFDNAAYTNGGPDVAAQLRALAPSHQTTLLAVDGAVCEDMHAQIARIPRDATHLFLSAGGNDALSSAHLLLQSVSSVGEAMLLLSHEARAFEKRHARLLDALANTGLPLAVGLIYNPRFSDETQQTVCVAALCLWNDAIARGAIKRGLPILDLRAICNSPEDYANDIEPSSRGAQKIASAIWQIANSHDFTHSQTTIYAQ